MKMTFGVKLRAFLLAVMMLLALPSYAQSNSFMARDHLVVDLRFVIEWLRCTVGKVWNGSTCVGEAVRLNHEQIEIAIEQASAQLGEGWRLPPLEELEGLYARIVAANDRFRCFSGDRDRALLVW